ncbi:DUF1800 domain-containing protein [Biformimicrobium ophioploci]|uniref:DUF1800 domain-containing protein n=1 Tax=Biformimicrobium ophioploci TaxID=3036711 RepID=A0ABQ6LUS0_9GAMM|nr:DUF1800 domain-containing protein [Microbulbifer sp. NKW57]GMG85782.1 hypothetical protein MNKW57_01030 [Microbulbifer sp. NKW57]
MDSAALIAANRFGYGPAPGELERIRGPRDYLRAQLAAGAELPAYLAAQDSSKSIFIAMRAQRMQKKKGSGERLVKNARDTYLRQAGARQRWAAESPQGLRERLVHFWSNHFAVSIDKPQVLPLAFTMEQEAIRPNITGNFADLLGAAIRHPAMLLYLDNTQSFGPRSRAGRRRKRGLNENLAREILELHTLGVGGGYKQADVRELAKAITGWTVGSARFRPEKTGEFVFAEPVHEPGSVTVLARRYADSGEVQGSRILRDLALHPSTAKHLAHKLAVHFVDDNPPNEFVKQLAEVYLDSGGELLPLYHALIDADEAWDAGGSKFRTPVEFVTASFRGLQIRQGRFLPSLRALGQVPFKPGSPAGWPDNSAHWKTPAALLARADWSDEVADKQAFSIDLEQWMDETMAGLFSDRTRLWVGRAETTAQGLALALMSPEFQQR